MTLLAGAVWTIVDDDGTGTTGTPLNAAWVAAVKASIEAGIHSTTNPTDTLKDIIDEIVDARGGFGDLDTRLDAMDTSIGSVPTVEVVQASQGRTNMALNDTFEVLHEGDTNAPTSWGYTGAGASVQRCGTALADTNNKIGSFCARLRRVAATSTLYTLPIPGGSFALALDAYRGKTVGFGAWVRSTGIAGAKLYITDGVGTTYSSNNAAAGTWEWLSLARLMDSAAIRLEVGLVNNTDGSDAYVSGATAIFTDANTPPSEWTPAPVEFLTKEFFITGNVTTGTGKFLWLPQRPLIVRSVRLSAATAPTGQALIVDVNTWDGAAFTTMFATKPQIAATAQFGLAQPDDTYARRCVSGDYFNPLLEGQAISIDVDQVGSGVSGAGLLISIGYVQPSRFLESVMLYNDLGI